MKHMPEVKRAYEGWKSTQRSILPLCEWYHLSHRLLQLVPTLLSLISILCCSSGNFKAEFSCLAKVLLSPTLREVSEYFIVSEILILSLFVSGKEILHFADDKKWGMRINSQLPKEIYTCKEVLRQNLRVYTQNVHCEKPCSRAGGVCQHAESWQGVPFSAWGRGKVTAVQVLVTSHLFLYMK